ncbi:MAG: transposase [Paracoccaceae bacterium]
MDHLEGAGLARGDRVDFDRRVRLEFRGAQISSDGGLLVMRELDDVLGLSNLASGAETAARKNTLHRLDGLFRQSVFGRLAGYEDVNVPTAWPRSRDASGRWRQGRRGASCFGIADGTVRDRAGSGRNRAALADLSGQWIDRFMNRNGLKYIVLDMDSSVSHPRRSGRCLERAFRLHLLSPSSCSTSLACWSAAPCVTAMSTAPMAGCP